MIVDFHTHVFPPHVAAERERYARSDTTFAEMYASPEAKLATAEDLLGSMDSSGVDVSVALGFAWSDADTCRQHNDYLLSQAADSGGRVVAFPNLPLAAPADVIEQEMRRCVAVGAPGFGELRPGNLGFDLAGAQADRLAALAAELGVALLFHVSEPVGHRYPGKQGLDLADFYAFAAAHPDVKTVGAHWAGGLPFYAEMPEVKKSLAALYVDTAATSLLYDETVYVRVAGLVGARRILFGSDYPLLSQARSRKRIEEAGLDDSEREMILGANAAALLGLE